MEPFLKSKNMEFPRSVWIGHDRINDSAALCDELRFKEKGLMITGENTYGAAGKEIEYILRDGGYDVTVVKTENATPENVNRTTDICREIKADFIVAVGGGSKIDLAKCTAYDAKIPFVSIPTSIAHDGITSNRASLKTGKGSNSVEASSPVGILADTAIINEAPYRYLAAGCADVISNTVALKDWELSNKVTGEEISSSAFMIAQYAAEELIENSNYIKPNSEESVWRVMRPIIASGVSMCIAGHSRPTSGSEHMFSHALDMLHPNTALHGEQCGLGTIMMMGLHGGDWARIRDALKSIGAPTAAKELKIPEEYIIEALVTAKNIRKDRFTILNTVDLNEKSAEELARKTGVI